MCWLTNLFSDKSNTDLTACKQGKLTLSSALSDRTEELNACSVLRAREYEKTTAYEIRIGQLSKNNQTLQQELANATDMIISLTCKIKELERGEK
jgi:hypothetical protein